MSDFNGAVLGAGVDETGGSREGVIGDLKYVELVGSGSTFSDFAGFEVDCEDDAGWVGADDGVVPGFVGVDGGVGADREEGPEVGVVDAGFGNVLFEVGICAAFYRD